MMESMLQNLKFRTEIILLELCILEKMLFYKFMFSGHEIETKVVCSYKETAFCPVCQSFTITPSMDLALHNFCDFFLDYTL